jgi:hypothetical protein
MKVLGGIDRQSGGLRIATAAAIASVALLLSTSTGVASGYAHQWQCYSASAAQCYDPSPCCHGWIQVSNRIPVTRYEVCAKAITAAGNIRTGSGCNFNTFGRSSCLTGETPSSTAYVYWAGTGIPTYNNGFAATPSSSSC